MRRITFVLSLLVFLALAGMVVAADAHDLSWHALTAGGRTAGGSFQLDGGVVHAGGVPSSGALEVQGGYWYGSPVTLFGDMDADCDVDIVDIMLVASRWNRDAGDPGYNARYDVDGDGDIDIVDIMLVAARWSSSCWD